MNTKLFITKISTSGSEEKTPEEGPGRMERVNRRLAEMEAKRNDDLICNQVGFECLIFDSELILKSPTLLSNVGLSVTIASKYFSKMPRKY